MMEVLKTLQLDIVEDNRSIFGQVPPGATSTKPKQEV